jgi:hypothetical protein
MIMTVIQDPHPEQARAQLSETRFDFPTFELKFQ